MKELKSSSSKKTKTIKKKTTNIRNEIIDVMRSTAIIENLYADIETAMSEVNYVAELAASKLKTLDDKNKKKLLAEMQKLFDNKESIKQAYSELGKSFTRLAKFVEVKKESE